MSWRDRQQDMAHVELPEPQPQDDQGDITVIDTPVTAEPDSRYCYKALKYETTYSVSRKLGLPESEFCEHNDIPHGNLVEGQIYRSPYPIAQDATQGIRYQEIGYEKVYYVNKVGGTRKYLFGNATRIKDITETGATYPQNYVQKIIAVAYVPIGTEEYAYFMDAMTYDIEAHRPRTGCMYGFAWNELTEGYPPAPEVEVPPTIEAEPTKVQEQIEEQLGLIEPKLEEVREWNAPDYPPTGLNPSPNKWKHTYRPFRDGSELFFLNEDVVCHDYDNKRPDKALSAHKTLKFAGDFEKEVEVNGVMKMVRFARPEVAVNMGSWHGVPMDAITSVYETKDVPEEDDKVLNPDKYKTWNSFIVTPLAVTSARYYHFVTPTVQKVIKKVKPRRKVQ